MVLAAGRGVRMRPLTDHAPKPMIEVAGRSLIDRALDRLEEAGVQKIVVNTSYKADILEDHLRERHGAKILFSREEEALETGGGIARALHHFGGQPFFAVNGDIIWLNGAELALKRLAAHWDDSADALLLLHPVSQATGYDGKGDFELGPSGALTRRAPDKSAPYVYAGVQLLHPRLFEGCPKGAFSLNVLYDKALTSSPPRIRALVHDGAWLHVGDAEGLRLAEIYLPPSGEGGQLG
jgi:N-acetyl-alpha-D-muramate 1-phosphate uridylyltransferase